MKASESSLTFSYTERAQHGPGSDGSTTSGDRRLVDADAPGSHASPKVAIRSTPQMNSTRFSSIEGSRSA